jgi:hypothetical protein
VSTSRMRALRVIGTGKYVPAARGRRNEMRKRKSDQHAQLGGASGAILGGESAAAVARSHGAHHQAQSATAGRHRRQQEELT